MKFTFNNLGYVDQGDIELGDMTLICGPNNVGKTWINYAIYGLLKHYPSLTSFDLDKELVQSLREDGAAQISLFYKELDLSKNILVEHLAANEKGGGDPFKLLNSMRSRYAEPIKDNINVVRDADNIAKQKSFLKEGKSGLYKPVFDALKEILGGSFKVVEDQVIYQPAKERNRDKTVLPIYLASSSVKSLFLLDLYINSIAEKNSVLIIDEPELNLHPDRQRQMAKLLARLVNAGVKVVMTTHSDFLVREINNRIMLNTDFQGRSALMKEHRLSQQDILRPEQVKAYTIQGDHSIHPVECTEEGIDTDIFDQKINEANALQDAIYYQLS